MKSACRDRGQESGEARTTPVRLLSIVVPIYNEAANLDNLLARIHAATEGLATSREVIAVNDGSTDHTVAELLRLRDAYPYLKIVGLSRNFGKETALTAGLDLANGDVVATLDADLQHPPELLPKFVDRWCEGFDMIYGLRASRHTERPMMRAIKRHFYHALNGMSSVPIPVGADDFRLMDRRVVDAVKRFSERTRFMKGIFAWVGFRTASVVYEVGERSAGRTSWNFWQLWNFALTGLTSFTTMPLRIWSYVGVTIAFFALLYSILVVVQTLVYGIQVPGYATIVVLILFLGGVQLISIGVLGEYVSRIFEETKQRPLYFLESTAGFEEPGSQPAGTLPRQAEDGGAADRMTAESGIAHVSRDGSPPRPWRKESAER